MQASIPAPARTMRTASLRITETPLWFSSGQSLGHGLLCKLRHHAVPGIIRQYAVARQLLLEVVVISHRREIVQVHRAAPRGVFLNEFVDFVDALLPALARRALGKTIADGSDRSQHD